MRALLSLTLVFLPTLARLWQLPEARVAAWTMLIYAVYLLVVLQSSHAEYKLRLDLDAELRVQRDRFETLSRLDGLTGLANRRHFSHELDADVAQAHLQELSLNLQVQHPQQR